MSTDFKEKGAAFVKSVKETDFKEKGAEFVRSVKENEKLNNTINKVGEEYNSLRKKQKGHIVEWLTFAVIFGFLGVVVPAMFIFTVIAVVGTIYLLKSKNTLGGLDESVSNCKSNMERIRRNYIKGMKESVKHRQWMVERDPHSSYIVDNTTERFTISREQVENTEREYNDAVMAYNYYIKAFPSCFAAYIWGYTPQKLITVDSDEDPTVLKYEADIDTSDFV